MNKLDRRTAVRTMLALGMACVAAAGPGQWSRAAEVHHDDNLCLAYRARLDGEYLVIRAAVEPGWHTFAMDNRKRAEEKLAGKKSLGIDHPTEFKLTGGLEVIGPWHQTPPKDFSKPELRWFSWGFEGNALFVAKIRRSGPAPVRIGVRGQACTDVTCKNIDLGIDLPALGSATASGAAAEIDWKSLVPVR
ncbi:MAG: hypothetical protein ABIZ80_00335 [Bryobacteraceae bacterium]